VTSSSAGVGSQPPLSTILSQLLVAFTIEFDNESEQRLPHRTTVSTPGDAERGPWLVSMAMWANLMRYLVEDEVPLTRVEHLAAITNLAGLQRWGYLRVDAEVVRVTRSGRRVQRVWRGLTGEIEQAWRDRFGAPELTAAATALAVVAEQLPGPLPRFLPVVSYADGMLAGAERVASAGRQADDDRTDLPTLLARVLLAFTLDYEQHARVSLPLTMNVLRLVRDEGVRVRDLPGSAGVSREGIDAAVGFLQRRRLVAVEADPDGGRSKWLRITPAGRRAQSAARAAFEEVATEWRDRYGAAALTTLRTSLDALRQARDADGQPLLARGLTGYPEGWRAQPPYATRTRALIADPIGSLPHYPMVLHRGGFPDGS
jgi:DNA-binding MarR family transcriptional regulator